MLNQAVFETPTPGYVVISEISRCFFMVDIYPVTQMLVEVFAPEFRNPKNMHLKNFFVILPALVNALLPQSVMIFFTLIVNNTPILAVG